MWQPPGPSQSGEHGARGNHPLVVFEGKGKWRASIDDPLVLPKGQDNLWALPRKRGQGRASGDYLLIVSKRRCQSPGPSQREGIRKGKRWQPPGRTRKGTTPGLFPKERLSEGKQTTPELFPKKRLREGIWRQPPWLVLSEGKDQGPREGEWWFLQFFPWSTAQFTGLCFWVSKPLCLIQTAKQNLHGRPRSHSYDKWIGYVFCHVMSCLFLVPFCH